MQKIADSKQLVAGKTSKVQPNKKQQNTFQDLLAQTTTAQQDLVKKPQGQTTTAKKVSEPVKGIEKLPSANLEQIQADAAEVIDQLLAGQMSVADIPQQLLPVITASLQDALAKLTTDSASQAAGSLLAQQVQTTGIALGDQKALNSASTEIMVPQITQETAVSGVQKQLTENLSQAIIQNVTAEKEQSVGLKVTDESLVKQDAGPATKLVKLLQELASNQSEQEQPNLPLEKEYIIQKGSNGTDNQQNKTSADLTVSVKSQEQGQLTNFSDEVSNFRQGGIEKTSQVQRRTTIETQVRVAVQPTTVTKQELAATSAQQLDLSSLVNSQTAVASGELAKVGGESSLLKSAVNGPVTQAAQQLEETLTPLIEKSISTTTQFGKQTIVFNLKPANLGSMKVVVQANSQAVSLTFELQDPTAKELLQKVTHQLEHIMEQFQLDLPNKVSKTLEPIRTQSVAQTLTEKNTGGQPDSFMQNNHQQQRHFARAPARRAKAVVTEITPVDEKNPPEGSVSLLV